MALTVRTALLDEAPLVREIMLAAYAEYKGALPVDSGAHAETVDDVSNDMQRGGAVLAYDGDRAVGSTRYRLEEELYAWRVAVLPAHRRRGVASAMMRFLEDVALRLDRHAIRIEVRDSLPSNVGLYESLGYVVVSIDPHPRGPDHVHTMVKSLSIPGERASRRAV
jgi:ribosomal protein S18 acetylase RimI-like enzyme